MGNFEDSMRITLVLELLSRFPQCAYIEMCGDRGIEDLRVWAPIDGNEQTEDWRPYKIDEQNLPWTKDNPDYMVDS